MVIPGIHLVAGHLSGRFRRSKAIITVIQAAEVSLLRAQAICDEPKNAELT